MQPLRSGAPSAFPAVTATACAIVNLGGCFAAVVGGGGPGLTMLLVLCVMVLMGVAVFQWYVFVRAYVDHRTRDAADPRA